MTNHPNRGRSKIQTVAVCFRAGKELSRKWKGRVSDDAVIDWLATVGRTTANVRVTEFDGTKWIDHGDRRVDAHRD